MRKKSNNLRRTRAIARVLRRSIQKYERPVIDEMGRRAEDPFRVLITTVLSLRTQDRTTAAAAERLFRRARTPQALLTMSVRDIGRTIFPVGMSPTKACWLREIARIIRERHGGSVPRTQEELMEFPGVGPKVANLVLGVCFGIPAICVDTHVHRVSNRLGLVRTGTPEESEQALERVLPRDLWIEWNALLVTWGQNVCTPRRPRCSLCPLRVKKLCPQVGVRFPR